MLWLLAAMPPLPVWTLLLSLGGTPYSKAHDVAAVCFLLDVVLYQIIFQLVLVRMDASWKPLCFSAGVEMFPGWNDRRAEVDCNGGE